MILDSTFLLDLLREDDAAFRKGMELHEAGTVARVPAAAMFETYYGVGATGSDDELRRVQNVLMGYPPVPVDEEIVRVAGRMLGRVDTRADGTSGVGTNDAYIGATARVLDEPVLTRNERDFEALPGVEVKTY
jgi:predicted nucleic acid-binding protein